MKFHRHALLLVFGALAAGSALAAPEVVYRLIDKNGQVHYSDTPREGWTKLEVRAPASDDATPPEPGSPAALRAEECERKKKQLETYRTASTIKERDALGRDREYSAQERAQLLELTQKQVGEACGPAPQVAEGEGEEGGETGESGDEQAQAQESEASELLPGAIR